MQSNANVAAQLHATLQITLAHRIIGNSIAYSIKEQLAFSKSKKEDAEAQGNRM